MSKCTPTNRVSNFLNPAPISEFDALLKQFLSVPHQAESRGFAAPVSVWESEGHYHLELDAPGVRKRMSTSKSIVVS